MKKGLALTLAAVFVMSVAGTAFAAVPNPLDIKLDGSATLQWRADDFKNAEKASAVGLKTIFVLNASKEITKNLDLYARFTYEAMDNASSEGTFADYLDRQYNSAIDAFGFKYNNAGVNYVLGQSPLTLGQTGLLYDANIFVGKHANPYIFSVNGKTGAVDLTAVAAQTNYGDYAKNDKIYSVRGTYATSKSTTVGATLARADYDNTIGDSHNYWAADFSHKLSGKTTAWGEYIKSDFDKDNKGYWVGVTYAADAKNTFKASYWRVEDAAAILGTAPFGAISWTTQWANEKGVSLKWGHKISQDVSFDVADHIFTKINADADTKYGFKNDRNTFRAGLTFIF